MILAGLYTWCYLIILAHRPLLRLSQCGYFLSGILLNSLDSSVFSRCGLIPLSLTLNTVIPFLLDHRLLIPLFPIMNTTIPFFLDRSDSLRTSAVPILSYLISSLYNHPFLGSPYLCLRHILTPPIKRESTTPQLFFNNQIQMQALAS